MFDVFLYDVHVGTLEARGRGIRFTYLADAVDDDALPAISLALPKRKRPFPDSDAGPFFRNLLPEQSYRRLVAAAAATPPENDVALLGAIGGECPGAVSIWPAGAGPPREPEYDPLTPEGLARLFDPASRSALATAVARGRLSLPGVQEKIALFKQGDGDWYLPRNGAVTSHILKQATPAFADLLENELLCMALAGRAGLTVATAGLAAPDVRVYCTERFDRARSGIESSHLRRKVHQEDFCQILTTEPERKYEMNGGPGLRRCAEVIRKHSGLPAEDLERLVRWVGFNYTIGNEDAHAKNLGLLYREDGLRLTPHYDLVSTEVYSDLERSLAMKIGGAWDIRNVQRRDWERVATAVKLPWRQVRFWLLDTMGAVRGALPGALEHCRRAYGEAEVYGGIGAVVARRAVALERELARAA